MFVKRLLALVFLPFALQGCVKGAHEEQPRYFWPPVEAEAKIEYLGFYASEANLRGALFSNVAEVVLGVNYATPLFNRPFAIDAHRGKVVVTDAGSRRVFVLDLQRRTLGTASVVDDQQKTFGFPAGVAVVNDHEFLLVDSVSQRVNRYSMEGELLGFFGEDQLIRPTSVALDRSQQRIAVVDTAGHRLAIFSMEGTLLGYLGKRGSDPGQFNFPVDADFDTEGNLFVLDSMNFRVQRFSWNGAGYEYVGHFGENGTADGSFIRPKGLAVSPSGHVYITDGLAHKVIVFDRDGTFLLTFGGKFIATNGQFAPGGLYVPMGIAADEQDGIWVVDSLNRMVHHFQYLNPEYLRANPILPGQIAPLGLNAEE